MNGLLLKLLRQPLNPWQLAGFTLANFCGLAIVIASVQAYSDIMPLFTGADSFIQPGHIVVSKRVTTMGTLAGSSTAFSPAEVQDLRQQPFAQRVGAFTPAMFGVFATVGSQSLGVEYSTEMFFEAVPDEFIDTEAEQWHYEPGSTDVPIILPRTYLNLYNFGFASSQGLPTLSEGIVGKVSIRLRLTGSHGVRLATGHVVDFSRRLNTILVPQAFLDQMNSELSPEREPQPSRLIVSVDNPADSRISDYLGQCHYDVEAADADAARAASLLRRVLVVVAAVGMLITILACYVLLLSIFLLLQKQEEKLDSLLLIGYTPAAVARPFHLLTLALCFLSLLAAFAAVAVLRGYYLPLFGELQPSFQPAAVGLAISVGVALFLLATAVNTVAIRRKVNAIWHLHEEKK